MTESNVLNVPHKSSAGADLPPLSLDAAKLDVRVRQKLIKDAIVMYQANRRQGTHSTKTRSEVAGSRKKLWRQKGTGRARPGNRQNPVWKGGGVVFGPRPRDYSYSINRKQKQLATRSALFGKFRDGEVIVVDSLSLSAPKTREAAKVLTALGIEGRCLIGTDGIDGNLVLAVRNIPRVKALPVTDFNAEEVLSARTIVLTEAAFDRLTADPPEPVEEPEAAEFSAEPAGDAGGDEPGTPEASADEASDSASPEGEAE